MAKTLVNKYYTRYSSINKKFTWKIYQVPKIEL